ncbi:hypothetical protein BDZ94DRAFT_1239994 [Collybia nuda]|uniref:Uncharacterized protein n=1 Tax=Collybia nuda TaxID=64659 RepID=A0A9P5XX68_9AGAR|nr:hypothetical protein BDZ94DRAFT_1239994 [Collybia nuda]
MCTCCLSSLLLALCHFSFLACDHFIAPFLFNCSHHASNGHACKTSTFLNIKYGIPLYKHGILEYFACTCKQIARACSNKGSQGGLPTQILALCNSQVDAKCPIDIMNGFHNIDNIEPNNQHILAQSIANDTNQT